MARYAPLTPTTPELQRLYPLDEVASLRVELGRERVGDILSGHAPGLVGIMGGCAMNEDARTIRREGAAMHDVTQSEEGLYVVQRRPPWKPRSDPNEWHGMETDDPDGEGAEYAYRTLASEATLGSGVAIELNWLDEDHRETHADRYGDLLTFGWVGGRAINDPKLMDRVALRDPTLPLGIKNGLDGEIEPALEHVERLRELRGEGAAPVVLVYRGGENAKDRTTWERNYRAALAKTGGRMAVDLAHGTEMAHHPDGEFKKSVEGQEDALEHVAELAEEGEMPTAVMAEASDARSRVDPHMRHAIALNGLVRLNRIRSLVSSSA
jgi:phospho-2-dehydro-3-deoxyheptonate aldolase